MRIILKSAFKMIKDNLFFNIIIILQLIITVFLMTSLVNMFVNITYQQSIVKNIKTDELLYYMGQHGRPDASIEGDYERYKIYENNIIINGDVGLGYIFDAELQKYFDIPLHKGRWFTNAVSEQIEIVVTANTGLSLGDTVELGFQTNAKNLIKTGKVVGILPSNYMFFDLNSGGSFMTLDDILRWNELELDDIEVSKKIYCNTKVKENEDIIGVNQSGSFIEFHENISAEEKTRITTELQNSGMLMPFLELKNNSAVLLREKLILGVPFCILVFLLTFLSFGLILLFINKRMTDYFSVLFLTGARWRTIYSIIGLYCLVISAFTLIVNLILSKATVNPFNIDMAATSLLNSFLCLLIVLSVFTAAAMGLIHRTFSKMNIIECLRRQE